MASQPEQDPPPQRGLEPPSAAPVHYACIAGVILCPIGLALPPRKFDIRFLIITSAFSLCSDRLVADYTGTSLYRRVYLRLRGVFSSADLPEGARRTQTLLREEKERRAAKVAAAGGGDAIDGVRLKPADGEGQEKRGWWKRIWAASEGEDWVQKRAEAERKALAEGKQHSDIIWEYMQEAFGKKPDTADKEFAKDQKSGSEAAASSPAMKQESKGETKKV
jgi:hypothetical protein